MPPTPGAAAAQPRAPGAARPPGGRQHRRRRSAPPTPTRPRAYAAAQRPACSPYSAASRRSPRPRRTQSRSSVSCPTPLHTTAPPRIPMSRASERRRAAGRKRTPPPRTRTHQRLVDCGLARVQMQPSLQHFTVTSAIAGRTQQQTHTHTHAHQPAHDQKTPQSRHGPSSHGRAGRRSPWRGSTA